jgi:CRISPR-associated protein Csm5
MKPIKIPFELTSLSPFHIGNGDDLDPFSIVIHNNYLYRLNQLKFIHYLLKEKEKEFQKVMYTGGIVAIRQFFQQNFNPEVKDTWFYKYKIFPYTAKEYEEKIKSSGNQGLIKEFIRNTALYQPYIPGSSIKGSIRTAILSTLLEFKDIKLYKYKNNNSNDEEVQGSLLKYRKYNEKRGKETNDITADPFKFFKFADIPFGNELISLYEVKVINFTPDSNNTQSNNSTKDKEKSNKTNGIPLYMELGMSFENSQSLKSELTLTMTDSNNQGLKQLLPKGKDSLPNFIQMIKVYYKTQFEKEINLLLNDSKLKDAYNNIQSSFNNTEKKENECIIRLGFGSGQNYCTYAKMDYKPKTRRIVVKENTEIAFPLGWFKMTFDLQ